MGYYTTYRLEISPEHYEKTSLILAWLKENTGYTGWYVSSVDLILSEAKWYDYQQHMLALTKTFPDVKFELFCDGEDGDQWIVYAWQGKTETCESERVFKRRTLW